MTKRRRVWQNIAPHPGEGRGIIGGGGGVADGGGCGVFGRSGVGGRGITRSKPQEKQRLRC